MTREGGTEEGRRKHWLIKSEPSTYAWDDLLRDGQTYWDGVRNFQARNNIRAMSRGDLALFYHSVKEKCVVGVARVCGAVYPDPTANEGDWSVVDVEPAFGLKRTVTLAEIKADPQLVEMALLKQSRLSVCPVSKLEFDHIVALGGKKRLS